MDGTLNEAFVVQFQALSQNLLEDSEEYHKHFSQHI
jgi:hypothetical protein